MLELPEIKSADYEETLANLVNKIPYYTKDWVNTSENSIGIMLLELFVFLQKEQQSNMNKIGGTAIYNIGKLLGYTPYENSPASCTVAFDCTGKIHKGTKLRTNKLVFETSQDISSNENKAILYGYTDGEHTISYFCEDKSQPAIKLFDKSDDFIIGFSSPLDNNAEVTICIDSARKLPDDMSGFIFGSETKWQYYGTENGKTDWHDVILKEDSTFACLKTGKIVFSVKGTYSVFENVYPIRCVVTKRCFDILPVFKGAYLNTSVAFQKDTKCTTINFAKSDFAANTMTFSDAIAENHVFRLFISVGKGFCDAESMNINFDVIYENSVFRLVTSSRDELSEIFDKEKDSDIVIKLVIYEQPYVRDFTEYSGNGTSNQQIMMNFNGLYAASMEIMVGEITDDVLVWQTWKYTNKLALAMPDEKVFTLDTEKGILIFGDGHCGAVPQNTNSKNILITSMCLTEGSDGNIPEGELITDKQITAIRITPASGGKKHEAPDVFLKRISKNKNSGIMLTAKDFADRAAETPGLRIKNAEVYATPDGKKGTIPNSVTISIEPDTENSDYQQLDWYLKNVYNYIDKFRPLTLDVRVVFPLCIPINIEVYAECYSNYLNSADIISSFLQEYFKNNAVEEVNYAEISKKLSSLQCIAKLNNVSIESTSVHAEIKRDGSIIIPPHSKIYIKKCQIHCK